MWPIRWRISALAALATAAALPAAAHDTWFAARAARLPGTVVLTLGTGNQFPVYEFSIGPEYLREHGCRQDGRAVALDAVANANTALLLQARVPGGGALTCWAQLAPFDVTLEPRLIGVYLDEIDASPAVRDAWARIAARGLPWKERYVKHARVEIAGGGPTDAMPLATPVQTGMDIVLQGGLRRLASGETLAFQVLRDGTPLAGQAIELRGQQPAQAQWLRTDGEGRASVTLPAPGRWVLRGVELRLSDSRPDEWDSRFVTLAFDVGR